MEEEKLKKIIAQTLSVDIDEIEDQTRFMEDLGADSLDLYQIALEVEKEFNFTMDESVLNVKTFREAMQLIWQE